MLITETEHCNQLLLILSVSYFCYSETKQDSNPHYWNPLHVLLLPLGH